ncbi:MAG: hypothetical protein JWN70_2903 [Planctomycetaceae bacterium]|nr:hypothetical protein [Planctomycetaceae bacterium]
MVVEANKTNDERRSDQFEAMLASTRMRGYEQQIELILEDLERSRIWGKLVDSPGCKAESCIPQRINVGFTEEKWIILNEGQKDSESFNRPR